MNRTMNTTTEKSDGAGKNKKNHNRDDSAAATKERIKRSISLVNFGQKKGHIRALEEFRWRKEQKRIETSKALRRYKKTMKHEGYEAGTGASRKRKAEAVAASSSSSSPGEGVSSEEVTEQQQQDRSNRRRKTNPFSKALEKAKEKKEETERKMKEMENNLKEKGKKIRDRKQQTRLLARRTKRGQPIMKHTVQNLLKKLQKQA